MTTPWPASPLAALDTAFGYLTRGPQPLTLDCRPLPGLPDRTVPLDDLRRLLLDTKRPVPPAARDLVWRELLPLARGANPAWKVATIAMAAPGLTRLAGRMSRGWHGDTGDLDAELLTGFVERMATLSLDAERICGKLLDAAARAARRARQWADDEATWLRVESAWSTPPRDLWDHPDWILARAVSAACIDDAECLLIGETRLGDVPLRAVADVLGLDVKLAAARRRRAEARLRQAIVDGTLDFVVTGGPARARAAAHLRRVDRLHALIVV